MLDASSTTLTSSALPKKMITSTGDRIPNIGGKWVRTHASDEAMKAMRKEASTPWVLSKMFEFMEAKFQLEHQDNVLICRVGRKLLSRGTLKFIVDGEEHPWGIQIPFLSQLSSNWSYRAWVDKNAIVVSHRIGDHQLTRTQSLSLDAKVLMSTVVLEMVNVDGSLSEVSRVKQEATREGGGDSGLVPAPLSLARLGSFGGLRSPVQQQSNSAYSMSKDFDWGDLR